MQTIPAPLPELLGPEDLVRDLKQLPSTPKVLPRLLDILRDDRASMEDVVSLIKLDPGMAARVLQIGNSAYYSPSRAARCPTMEDAVYRVGLVKVYELVAYAATSQLLMRTLRSYRLDPHDVWRISVTCAVAAERLAGRVEADFNTAYTVGLLHGIGLVGIDSWAVGASVPAHFATAGFPEETTASEKEQVGFTNASVAAALLRCWGFPAQITEPIRWQYMPALATRHRKMAALLHCAKWLRHAADTAPGEPLPPFPEGSILASIPLTEPHLANLLSEVKEAFLRASLLLSEPEAGD